MEMVSALGLRISSGARSGAGMGMDIRYCHCHTHAMTRRRDAPRAAAGNRAVRPGAALRTRDTASSTSACIHLHAGVCTQAHVVRYTHA
eukprot:scaffold22999_cov174-Isochrysis_galbana.AAC.2